MAPTSLTSGLILLLLVLFLDTSTSYSHRQVSQCFATKGNPFVSMHCGTNKHININKALHGRHSMNRSECHVVSDDCIEDQMRSFYDWPDCMGRQQCVQSVQQSWMPSCGNYSQFLQVDYSCVPAPALIDICKKGTYHGMNGYLRSPDYPDHYPQSRDCQCVLTPEGTDHLFISFFDLSLEMVNLVECADWLLLEAGQSSDRRTDLNCGEIIQNTKNITLKGMPVKMHFHSDLNDKRSQSFRFNTQRKLKGFWLYFRAEPAANITVKCGPTKPRVLKKLEPSPTKRPQGGDYYIGRGVSTSASTLTLSALSISAWLGRALS